jgi:hypothetical protein
MRISNYEIDMVAAQLKRLGLGDYYVTQLVTNDVNAYSGFDLVDKVRRMVNAGIGDAAIARCLIKKPEPRTFSSEFQRFCWELDESAHQQKLDRIRREKELEAARSRPVQRRTYEEEVTSSVLNIVDSVFEIGSILLSSKRK